MARPAASTDRIEASDSTVNGGLRGSGCRFYGPDLPRQPALRPFTELCERTGRRGGPAMFRPRRFSVSQRKSTTDVTVSYRTLLRHVASALGRVIDPRKFRGPPSGSHSCGRPHSGSCSGGTFLERLPFRASVEPDSPVHVVHLPLPSRVPPGMATVAPREGRPGGSRFGPSPYFAKRLPFIRTHAARVFLIDCIIGYAQPSRVRRSGCRV